MLNAEWGISEKLGCARSVLLLFVWKVTFAVYNMEHAGACEYYNCMTSRVEWNRNYVSGIMTSRAIDGYINESILRGRLVGGHLGRARKFWGGSPELSGPLAANNKYSFGILSSCPVDWHPCCVIWFRGGSGCLVIEMHGMPPSRPRGRVQASYQQLFLNMQFTYCIMHKLHEWSKKVLWQRFWLDFCTWQVVSARACAYQFLT